MKKLIITAVIATLGFTVAMAQAPAKTATQAKPGNKYGTVSKDAAVQKPATNNRASDVTRPMPVRKAGKPISRPATAKTMPRTNAKELKAAPAPRPTADAYDKGKGKHKKHTRVAKTSKGCHK